MTGVQYMIWDEIAKRMQIQEALTSQIVDEIQKVLKPLGVGVVVEAAHPCMTTRGIGQRQSAM